MRGAIPQYNVSLKQNPWRRAMDYGEERQEEQHKPEGRGDQPEEDARRFENVGRGVREGQSPRPGEEGTEEERRRWQETRDIGKGVDAMPEEADEHPQARND